MTHPQHNTKILHTLDPYWQAITAASARAEHNLRELQPSAKDALQALINNQPTDRAIVDLDRYNQLAGQLRHTIRALAGIIQTYDYPTGGTYDPDGPRQTLDQWANQYAPDGCTNCDRYGIYSARINHLDDHGHRIVDGELCGGCTAFLKAEKIHRNGAIIEADAKGHLTQPFVAAELAKIRQAAGAKRTTVRNRNRQRNHRAKGANA